MRCLVKKSLLGLCAIVVSCVFALPSKGDIILSDFNGVGLDGVYASWSTGTVTVGATELTVSSTTFGGGFDTFATVDISGYDTIALDLTVNNDTSPTVLAILQDGDGTQFAYRWFGLALGAHSLNFPLFPVPDLDPGYGDSFVAAAGGTAGLDLTSISAFQLQIDDEDTYSVAFDNLAVVPEPVSAALLMLGGLVFLVRARIRR